MIANPSSCFPTETVDDILFVTPKESVARLTGLDLAAGRTSLIDELHTSHVRGLVFDLAQLDAFGSQMIGTLFLAWKEGRLQGAKMVLCHVSAVARQVLEHSKLHALWPVYASREQAFDAFPPAAIASTPVTDTDTMRLGHVEGGVHDRLQLLQFGRHTIVGFGGQDLPADHALGRYLSDITELIEQGDCQELTFDLAGVTLIPSGFLGVMASVLKMGVGVTVQNASREVREVLALTNFDRLVTVE
jgi:anti-anti-sigma regulatory factor